MECSVRPDAVLAHLSSSILLILEPFSLSPGDPDDFDLDLITGLDIMHVGSATWDRDPQRVRVGHDNCREPDVDIMDFDRWRLFGLGHFPFRVYNAPGVFLRV